MSHKDKYSNFAELRRNEHEGEDYRILVEERYSKVVIIAPHGGRIEPGTSEIARGLAGSEFSLYCFEGRKPKGNFVALHITSNQFDEPKCVQLVGRSQIAVAVHGCEGKNEVVYVGGLDKELKIEVIKGFSNAGFKAKEDSSIHSGCDIQNICNRTSSEKGLQLEITRGLRRAMFKGIRARERENTTPLFSKFVAAVREVLLKKLK